MTQPAVFLLIFQILVSPTHFFDPAGWLCYASTKCKSLLMYHHLQEMTLGSLACK
jgi:hypothetical protein